MKLKLIKFDEETGNCELDVDEEGKQYLIERGFNALLIDVIKKIEESDERETPEGI